MKTAHFAALKWNITRPERRTGLKVWHSRQWLRAIRIGRNNMDGRTTEGHTHADFHWEVLPQNLMTFPSLSSWQYTVYLPPK